jgi:hypothetical protein
MTVPEPGNHKYDKKAMHISGLHILFCHAKKKRRVTLQENLMPITKSSFMEVSKHQVIMITCTHDTLTLLLGYCRINYFQFQT